MGEKVGGFTLDLFKSWIYSSQISTDGHEETFSSPIAFEISSNASKFAVFSAIRSLVLEHETKYNTLSKFESKLRSIENQARSKSDDDNEVKIIDALQKFESNKINVPFVSYLNIKIKILFLNDYFNKIL